MNHDLQASLARLREAQDESKYKGKMAQLGQLTAMVAHELCNPLGAVRTSTLLLEKEVQNLPAALAVECQLGLGELMVSFDPAHASRRHQSFLQCLGSYAW